MQEKAPYESIFYLQLTATPLEASWDTWGNWGVEESQPITFSLSSNKEKEKNRWVGGQFDSRWFLPKNKKSPIYIFYEFWRILRISY